MSRELFNLIYYYQNTIIRDLYPRNITKILLEEVLRWCHKTSKNCEIAC